MKGNKLRKNNLHNNEKHLTSLTLRLPHKFEIEDLNGFHTSFYLSLH